MMRLLISVNEREKEFTRLMNQYSEFYWASAWASVEFNCFDILKRNMNKIKKIIIGISFNQTHPIFIETFIKHKNVKFFKKTGELFHLKVYLFQNNKDDWELLLGSMNFTSAGFLQNKEVLILLNSSNEDSDEIYSKIQNLINDSWIDSKYFSKEDLEYYKKAYRKQIQYSKTIPATIQLDRINDMAEISWNEYSNLIEKEEKHNFKMRIDVLEGIRSLFNKYKKKHFKDMKIDERKKIAGFLGSKEGVDWNYFGSNRGPGSFTSKIWQNDKNISRALDAIPLDGNVTEEDYFEYIKYFKKAFPGSERRIGTATRLLAMKRPDIFVCVNKKNQKRLCKKLGYVWYNAINYERYWNEIIMRIRKCKWYNSLRSKDEWENKKWRGRVALLDCLFYE